VPARGERPPLLIPQAVYVCDDVIMECLKSQPVEQQLSAEVKSSLGQVLQSSDLKDGIYEGLFTFIVLVVTRNY
jgi:hypothetical protein